MNSPKYDFHGYTLIGPSKSTFYIPVESDQTVIAVKDSGIYAKIQFINSGLNVYAPNGTRTEGNNLTIL